MDNTVIPTDPKFWSKSNFQKLIARDLSWSSVKNFPRAKIVSSSYIWLLIFPIVANALSKLPPSHSFPVHGLSLEIVFSLPFNWKLLFLAALFFTLGNIIFFIACPAIVKKFSNYPEFRINGGNDQHLDKYSEFREVLEYAVTRKIVKKYLNEESDSNEAEKSTENRFWEIFRKADLSNLELRVLCSALYAIGILLIFGVLVRNIIYVFSNWCAL